MIPTSPEFQKAVVKGNRRSIAKILFGVYDVTAREDADPVANSSQPFTDVKAIKAEIRVPDYRVGSFEKDRFRLDGSMYLMPDDINPVQDIIGWWSEQMSDSECYFSNKVLMFRGDTDHIQLSNPLDIFDKSFVIEGYALCYDDGRGIILSDYMLPGVPANVGFEKHTNGRLRLYWDGNPDLFTPNGSVRINEMFHFAFARDKAANRLIIAVNGVVVAESLTSGVDKVATVAPRIGRDSRSGDTAFNGIIKGLKVWIAGDTISADDIKSMYLGRTPEGYSLEAFWKLDEGVGNIAHDLSGNGNNGTINGAVWVEQVPEITINFDNIHSSTGLGIFFGTEDYCTEFDITWYNGSTVLGYELVEGNNESEVNIHKPIENYNKIVIRFLKTRRPYRYARVMEVSFGLEEIFDEDVVSARVVEEIDPSMSTLSINTLSFTVINKDQKFNMLNPQGIYAYLQQRQKIVVQSGIAVGIDAYEFVPMGTFYLSDWKNATGLTATLDATDAIGLLDRTTYASSPMWVNEPVENVLRHIIDDAGQFSMIVSPEVQAMTVSGYIPVKSHREALHDVLVAAMANLRVSRDNVLEVMKVDYTIPVVEIDYDTIIGDPAIEQKQFITAVQVHEYSYKLDTEVKEIASAEFALNGTQEIMIDFGGKAAANLSVSITGGTIVDGPHYSAVAARMTVTANGVVTVSITGQEYIESARTVTADIGQLPEGQVPQIATLSDNKMIASNGPFIAENLLAYYQKRIKQTFDYWSNPALQAGDNVEVETMFGTSMSGVIERQEIDLAPTLKARVEVTG